MSDAPPPDDPPPDDSPSDDSPSDDAPPLTPPPSDVLRTEIQALAAHLNPPDASPE